MGEVIPFQRSKQGSKKPKKGKKKKQSAHGRNLRDENNWYTIFDLLSYVVTVWPWDAIDEDAVFAYAPKEGGALVYFRCVSAAAGDFSIVIYPSIQNLLLDTVDGTARDALRGYIEMENFEIFLTLKEELPAPLLVTYGKLGVDFGTGFWPGVCHKRRGHLSDVPEGDELAFVLDCLGNFQMMLRAMEEGMRAPNPDAGEMMLRAYSDKNHLWNNLITPVLPDETPGTVVTMRDDSSKLQHLRSLSPSETVKKVEFDYFWEEEPVYDKEKDISYFPMHVVFADRDTGEPLSGFVCEPEELMNAAFSAWAEVLEEYGIPHWLYLKRDETEHLFADFADKLGVKVKRVKRLTALEPIMRENDWV